MTFAHAGLTRQFTGKKGNAMTNTAQKFTATKKPVSVETIQLTESNIPDVYKFIYGHLPSRPCKTSQDAWEAYEKSVIDNGMDIKTLEDGDDGRAKHVATIGDFIIRGGQGEYWPVKKDIMPTLYDW